jgi:PDZ domain
MAMQIIPRVFLFFVCSLCLCSCASWQAVKVASGLNISNEIIIKPELQTIVSGKKQNIKIVLRVPGAPKNITQEAQKEVGLQYDRLERELSKVGFIVRDRELLEKVVSELKPANYMELARAIDTDLILEVLYLGPYDLSHKQYYDTKAGRLTELNNPSMELKHPGSLSFLMHGGQIDCRVVTVRDGTVSGMFTLYNLPCDGLCDFEVHKGKEWRNSEPNPEEIKGWGVGTDEQNIRQLATMLMQTLNAGEIVVSKIQPMSLAAKNGLRINDIIEKLNDQPVYNLSQAADMIVKSDGKIEILAKRDDKEIHISFVKRFAEPIGIQLDYRPKVIEVVPEAPAVVEVKQPVTQQAPVITPVSVPAVTAPAKTVKKNKKQYRSQ